MSRTAWVIVIGIAVLVILMLISGLVAPLLYGRGYDGWGMMGGYGFLPMMGIGMGFGMIIFWVLIIAGGVWLVQSLSHGAGSNTVTPPSESPFEILKRRYAKGEITKDQFDQMKRDLGL